MKVNLNEKLTYKRKQG